MYVRMCIRASVHECVCVHAHTERERERERERDREREGIGRLRGSWGEGGGVI